mgnify:CR=1 FL=1
MKPLVTVLGGTGFVGTELISRLARAGYRLRVLTRDSRGSRTLAVLPTVEQRATAVHDAEALTRAIAGSDVVINLVGILNESGFSGRGFAQAHTELVRKTLAACAANGVTRFLQMSSLGASESAPSHYLRSKGAAERLIREAPPALRWTILRPSVIFGTHDSLVNRFAGLLRLTGGLMPLARAEARFAPVWVGDVTQAFEIALLHHVARDEDRVLAPKSLGTQLFQHLCALLGIARKQRDLRALRHQGLGHRRADPARRPCHQCGHYCEVKHSSLLEIDLLKGFWQWLRCHPLRSGWWPAHRGRIV